ncbi:D-sedoheptulose 7-phosphate isomerase [uncultured Gammaproteobacteria bacterium]
MEHDIAAYFSTLSRLGAATAASDASGGPLALTEAFTWSLGAMRAAHDAGGKIMFIGNGGSAAIASHCAIDYAKNGGLRAMAFNDGMALTCLGNDLGYDQVFAQQIAMHGQPGDLLVAISSSGASPNILQAVGAARRLGGRVVTLSGFKPDNPLRRLGDVNLYVESIRYGFVEILHLALCHAMLDLAGACGAARPNER